MPLSVYSPPSTAPQVLYIDETIIVVNKPAGLLSVPGRGEEKKDCLISRVQTDYADALIVHRLDMPTSGLLLLARSTEAHRILSCQFQNREIEKEYIAVVTGIIYEQTGEINLPLFTDWPNRPKQMVNYEYGKPSITHYEVLARDNDSNTTRIKLTPVTGRSHQLRVHLLSIGHPIVGDYLYSDVNSTHNERLMLHANKIDFKHPTSGKKITIESPSPF